jgi:hypothetical protein
LAEIPNTQKQVQQYQTYLSQLEAKAAK